MVLFFLSSFLNAFNQGEKQHKRLGPQAGRFLALGTGDQLDLIRKSPSASCRVWAPCAKAVQTWRENVEPKWRGHGGVGSGTKTSWWLLMAPPASQLGSLARGHGAHLWPEPLEEP